MSRKVVSLVIVGALFAPVSAWAQSGNQDLVFLLPTLFGSDGVIELVDNGHEAHFGAGANFTEAALAVQRGRLLNVALATQLTGLPLPSSAAGLIFTTDPETGIQGLSRTSLGPILSERAETVGAGQFNLSFSYQYFSFDTLDGIALDSIPQLFPHCDCPAGFDFDFKEEFVSTVTTIGATVNQFTPLLTFGLIDKVDVSVAVPFVSTSLDATAVAVVDRSRGTVNSNIHVFPGASPDSTTFSKSGSKAGIGDVIARIKANPTRSSGGSVQVAVGADFRFPTGDEMNLLGSGAFGVKPFAVVSGSFNRISPHANIAFQWNGESVLATEDILAPNAGKADLPDQVSYAFGFDAGVSDAFTFVFDILGNHVLDADRFFLTDELTTPPARNSTFTGLVNTEVQQDISFDIVNAAAGFKFNPRSTNAIIVFNLLFKLNDSGLRDKVTPLFGVEYAF